MRIEKKHLVTGALLAFVAVTGITLAVKETAHARAVAKAETSPVPAEAARTAPAERPATVFVTYFHTTARCVSCLKIEDLTNATMAERFAAPIAEKRVVWRSVNLDEPANAHFAKDYDLYTKSVVVSEVKGGFEVRWKNLDQVWHLLGNPESFQSYVEREVQAFLEKA
jgi:hypothetical protein